MRKIIAVLIVISLINIFPFYTSSHEISDSTNSDFAAANEAIVVSINHIISCISTYTVIEKDGDAIKNSNSSDLWVNNNWKSGVDQKNFLTLFGLDDKPSAYLIELCDLENNDAGYILVSANKSIYPVLSYQESGKHFISDANLLIENNYLINTTNSKYYYLYDGTYLEKIGDTYFDITSSQIVKLSDQDVSSLVQQSRDFLSISNQDNINYWDFMLEDRSVNMILGHNGNYTYPITNPTQYESGWSQMSTDWCTNMGTEFYQMEDLKTAVSPWAINHCGSTSGTNLTAYWKRREPTLCQNVASAATGLSVYKTVFSNIYPLMGGDGPVFSEEYEFGIESYFHARGVPNANAIIDAWPTFETDCKSEINAGRPVPTQFWGHPYYALHWVTTFGYMRFLYGSTWQNYIRIADGWCTNASRYDYALTNNSRYANNILKFSVQ